MWSLDKKILEMEYRIINSGYKYLQENTIYGVFIIQITICSIDLMWYNISKHLID